ncbi:MAG: hypothetical protein ACN6OQ_20645 [Paraburkholderia nemoris]
MSPKLSITAQKISQAIAVGVSAACSDWGVAEDMMAWVANSDGWKERGSASDRTALHFAAA